MVALIITHMADLSLRDQMRRDIVQRISRAPLAWFTASTSGRIRKAVQDRHHHRPHRHRPRPR